MLGETGNERKRHPKEGRNGEREKTWVKGRRRKEELKTNEAEERDGVHEGRRERSSSK